MQSILLLSLDLSRGKKNQNTLNRENLIIHFHFTCYISFLLLLQQITKNTVALNSIIFL